MHAKDVRMDLASVPTTDTFPHSEDAQDTDLETMEKLQTVNELETMEYLIASAISLDDLEGLEMPPAPYETDFSTDLEEPEMPAVSDSLGGTQTDDAGTLPLGTVLKTTLTHRGEISEHYSHHLGTRIVIDDDIDPEPWVKEIVYRSSDLFILAGLTPDEVVEVDRCLHPASAASALPRKFEIEGTEAKIWNNYRGYGISADITEPDETLLVTLVESLAKLYEPLVGQRETICCSGPLFGDRTFHTLARFSSHDTFIRVDARIIPGDTISFELIVYSGDWPVEIMHIPYQDGKVKKALIGIAVNHIGGQIDFHVPWESGAWG